MSELIVDCEAGTIQQVRDGVLVHAGCVTRQGYRQVKVRSRTVMAHRLVWEKANGPIPYGLQVDHINGRRDDNRIANLRLVTVSQNAENKHSAQANSRSGVKGVHWCERLGKWRAMIQTKGKLHALGCFLHLEDASEAYAAAAKRLHTHNPHAA